MYEIKQDEVNAITGAGGNDDLQSWLYNMMRELERQNRYPGDPLPV